MVNVVSLGWFVFGIGFLYKVVIEDMFGFSYDCFVWYMCEYV